MFCPGEIIIFVVVSRCKTNFCHVLILPQIYFYLERQLFSMAFEAIANLRSVELTLTFKIWTGESRTTHKQKQCLLCWEVPVPQDPLLNLSVWCPSAILQSARSETQRKTSGKTQHHLCNKSCESGSEEFTSTFIALATTKSTFSIFIFVTLLKEVSKTVIDRGVWRHKSSKLEQYFS